MPARTFDVFADDLVFGEGMRWFRGQLWMSDMLGRKVYRFDGDGAREVVADVPARANGLGFLPDGRLLIASMADQCVLRREPDGTVVVHSDLKACTTGYLGDMVVDATGRAYIDDVGFRVFEKDERRDGGLVRVDPDGTATRLEDGLKFPNGLWLTPAGDRVIFAEGRNETIFSYRIEGDGSLADKRVFARLPGRVFDGLTVDVEGAVWVCCPYDHEIIRVRDGGEVVESLPLPNDRKPVACALGGANLTTLYVVAADYTLERMAVDDSVAEIYRTEIDVPGFLLPGDPG